MGLGKPKVDSHVVVVIKILNFENNETLDVIFRQVSVRRMTRYSIVIKYVLAVSVNLFSTRKLYTLGWEQLSFEKNSGIVSIDTGATQDSVKKCQSCQRYILV